MAKVRVHQLAKELGMSSKELIEKLREELDINVKSAQSSLDEKQVRIVKEFLQPVVVVEKKEEERLLQLRKRERSSRLRLLRLNRKRKRRKR